MSRPAQLAALGAWLVLAVAFVDVALDVGHHREAAHAARSNRSAVMVRELMWRGAAESCGADLDAMEELLRVCKSERAGHLMGWGRCEEHAGICEDDLRACRDGASP